MTVASETPGRARRLAWRRLAAAVAIVAWVLIALVLLRTTVPGGLELPAVDVRKTFGAGVVDEARHFERVLILIWVASEIALLGALWLYAKRGVVFLRESVAGPIGSGMLLGMLGLALTWAVQKPFGLVELWWSRRHGVSQMAYWEWLVGAPLELAVSFAFICLALLVVMALARFVGEWWWIPGAAVFTAIAFAFALVGPYLSTTHAPDDPRLVATYERLARAEGVHDVPLVVEDVSGETSQANAYAFGILGTRRIVVWDTLLDGRFSDDEVGVVLAHELGHQAGRHIDKALAWFALFALPGAWCVMRLTRRRGGMATAEAVPLALLVIVCYSLVTGPLQNAISRRIEADADWRALRTTRDPAAARGLFIRFASTSLGDPSPPTWAYLLFENHPTLAQRVAMANAWERLRTP
jgi:STE24 endopeptidase